jgi:predicted ArsR family transcriptional regulator
MTDASAADRWQDDRTTFQRVYDVLVGTRAFTTAGEFAERVDCSETAARDALEQLVEMGISERRGGRPVGYRRNDSYLRWKRIESLAREHTPAELRDRLADLVERDEAFQTAYGVSEPDAVSTADLPVDDHEAVEDRWADVSEWRTVRRDVTVIRRAVERAERRTDSGVQA